MSELTAIKSREGDCYHWKIRNFNTIGRSLDSDRFKLDGCDGITWYLQYRLGSESIHNLVSNLDAYEFYLVRDYQHDDCQLDAQVEYRFHSSEINFNVRVSKFFSKQKTEKNSNDCLNPAKCLRRSNDRPNDLLVRFDVLSKKLTDKIGWHNEVMPKLATSMTKYLADGQFADVMILVGNEEFKAHKLMLAAQSPVFESMFSQEMIEKQTNIVEINDISSDVFKAFLHYIYLGPFNEITKFCDQLIQVADKYQVEVLKKYCEEHLIKSISIANCLELLKIGDLSSSKKLVDAAIDFLKSNRNDWDQIENFKDFFVKHPLLMFDLLLTVK